jgi:PilZ domain
VTDQRRSPRAKVKVRCTLHRKRGGPITGHTVDLGPGGMCVCTTRPLAADEVVRFELPPDIDGRGRVLRQQGHDTYAVRFELLGEPARAELNRLAMAPT